MGQRAVPLTNDSGLTLSTIRHNSSRMRRSPCPSSDKLAKTKADVGTEWPAAHFMSQEVVPQYIDLMQQEEVIVTPNTSIACNIG